MMSKIFKRNFKDVFNACKIAIKKCGFSIDSMDETRGYIYASSPPSIFSWGEDIVLEVKKKVSNEVEVTVKSMPKAQLFDWGKSRGNERRIMEYLDYALR